MLTEIFPPKTGGSGRWFWEIYKRLPTDEFLVVAGAFPGDALFDRNHDLNLIRMPLQVKNWGIRSVAGLHGYGRLAFDLRHVVRQHGVGTIHAGRCLPEGWLAWILKRIAGVSYSVYVHGEDVQGAATSREYRWMVDRVFSEATSLIANSRNTAKILFERWRVPEDRVKVLFPGVDSNRFLPSPIEPAIRRRLGWDGRTVVLTVGRLQKRKGHDQLIRGLKHIRQAVPDVLYSIVGEGQERTALEELIQQEGMQHYVQLLGEIDDDRLVECYQQCDLFVLPNRQVKADIEGFGMVLLEAQACGKPVVAGDSGGTVETMQIPETGRIVSCEHPELLARTITELLKNNDMSARMGIAARKWAVSRFDWEVLATEAYRHFQEH